ncbi:MAG: type IV pilus assembly protein PilM [Phycisphaerae bacterium]
MAGPVAVWGIDVGKCAVKALKLRAGADGMVDIIDQDYQEHPSIISEAEGNHYQLIGEALQRFLSRHDVTRDKIVVGVPGQHTLARFSKLPPVEAKKIPDIVRYEADQQIPFDLDEVIWDYQTFQEEDSPDIEVGIFAIKRDLIRDYLIPYELAGIEPIAVQAAPLALYNAMQFDQRLEEGASVLLDVGAENTNLIVATRHSLWTRTIPLGGNKFTEALVKAFKLSFSKAENLKRTAATSKYARQVFQAMRPVFAEFVQELSRSLGFYRSTHRDIELKRVIGLGNAFKLPGLQKYLQQNLQMPVDRPESFKMANAAEIRDDDVFKEQLPSFVVSYGLAVQGLEMAKALPPSNVIKSNLLPPSIVKQVVWRKKRPFFAAAAACLVLASGMVWFRRQSDLGTLAADKGQNVSTMSFDEAVRTLKRGVSGVPPRQEGATWLAVAEALSKEEKKYKNEGLSEVQRSKDILTLQRNKAVWPKILSTIHAALPAPLAGLADAKGPVEYASRVHADLTGKLARNKRTEVFIESFKAEYYDDLSSVDLYDVVVRDNIDTVDYADPEKRSGFLVTLRCRTPNGNRYQYVADAFRTALHEKGRQSGAGFFINRVVITGGWDFGDKDGKRTPPPGVPPTRRRPPKTKPRKNLLAFKYDPVTDETMDNDWSFEMKLDVVLADLPEKPPKEQGP